MLFAGGIDLPGSLLQKNQTKDKVQEVPGSNTAVYAAATKEEKPKIAITFDDGPSAECTPMLLDGLKERGVKATFFLIGQNEER